MADKNHIEQTVQTQQYTSRSGRSMSPQAQQAYNRARIQYSQDAPTQEIVLQDDKKTSKAIAKAASTQKNQQSTAKKTNALESQSPDLNQEKIPTEDSIQVSDHIPLPPFACEALQNSCKTILANIRFASVDKEMKTIAITSANPNEGKTITAINLAVAIASSGKNVLLVDCDMRRRSLFELIGIENPNGVFAATSGAVTLGKAVTKTSMPHLYFMDCEDNIPNPSDILASTRFEKMVSVLRSKFDYVVFDTPPVGSFIDAAVLSRLCDGVAIALRQNKTKYEEAEDAIAQLRNAGAYVIGAIVTFAERTKNNYYYAYYDKQGNRIRKSGYGYKKKGKR